MTSPFLQDAQRAYADALDQGTDEVEGIGVGALRILQEG